MNITRCTISVVERLNCDFSIPAVPLSVNNFGQIVDSRVAPTYVTKQCNNSVPVTGQWRPMTGKVTVGLMSLWQCVTDLTGLSTYRVGQKISCCIAGCNYYGTI